MKKLTNKEKLTEIRLDSESSVALRHDLNKQAITGTIENEKGIIEEITYVPLETIDLLLDQARENNTDYYFNRFNFPSTTRRSRRRGRDYTINANEEVEAQNHPPVATEVFHEVEPMEYTLPDFNSRTTPINND